MPDVPPPMMPAAPHRAPVVARSRVALLRRLLLARVRRLGPVFLGACALAMAGIYALERGAPDSKVHNLADAAWFLVVTLATVGYGDVYPVTAAGRAVAGGFILFTLGTLGVLLTAINESVAEVKQMEDAGLIGTRMRGHVVVCGFGAIARAALHELLEAGRDVALICERAEDIAAARQFAEGSHLFVTSGEPTQDVLRDRMNAASAETVVIAFGDDALNLIAALNARAVNPGARIIVALQREELRQTLIASGVTYVASPNELSGRLVASAAFEPEVAHFIEDVMSGAFGHYDVQQFTAAPFAGLTVREVNAKLEEFDGPLLLAVARPGVPGYAILPHPPRDLRLDAKDYLIVLANEAQARAISERYQIRQGRHA